VFPPANNNTDLSITFIDWAPPPADGTLGLWRDVAVTATPAGVVTRYPVVATSLSTGSAGPVAHLTVSLEVTNLAPGPVTGTLTVVTTVPGLPPLTTSLTVPGGATVLVTFDNATYPALNVASPGLWWPAQMMLPAAAPPTLYNLTAWFTCDATGASSGAASWRFGIREVGGIGRGRRGPVACGGRLACGCAYVSCLEGRERVCVRDGGVVLYVC
jgi:exo-1,4-beta-D-glucosaminidase